jgi:hypothetical protein
VYKEQFGDETFSSTADESSDSIIVPHKANFYCDKFLIHFFENDSDLYYADIDAPLDVFFDQSNWHPLNNKEMIWLLANLPRIAPDYVQREYFNRGFSLINGTLPTQTDMLTEAQNSYINNRNTKQQNIDYSTPSEWALTQTGIVEDPDSQDLDPNMDMITSEIELNNLLTEMETDAPLLVDSDGVPIKSLSDGLWANEVDEINFSTFPTDNIIIDETSITPKTDSDDNKFFTTDTDCSSGIERVPDESFEHPKKPEAYKNIKRSPYEYPERFRGGNKNRGALRCNNNKQTKHNWTIKNDKTPEVRSALKILQNEKRDEKRKMGKLWKGREALSKNQKHAKLLSDAFHHSRLQKAGDLDGKLEAMETEMEFRMNPDPNHPRYENFYKEREYYLVQLDKLRAEKKRKEYQTKELRVNKGLLKIMEGWHSEDLFSYTHTSSLLDDIEKVESFLKTNVTSDEMVKTIIDAVHKEVEKTPTLLDKATKFIENLIVHIKPIALSVDSFRDITLAIEIYKKQYSVELLDAIPLTSYLTTLGLDPMEEFDLRDDHARRGDLVHKDPLLQYVKFSHLNRDTIVATTTTDVGIVSMELLFQLTAPSVCIMNASEEIVLAKMQHIASNIHTINLPKMGILQNRLIVNDTIMAAFNIFRSQRRISLALGFPCPPQ